MNNEDSGELADSVENFGERGSMMFTQSYRPNQSFRFSANLRKDQLRRVAATSFRAQQGVSFKNSTLNALFSTSTPNRTTNVARGQQARPSDRPHLRPPVVSSGRQAPMNNSNRASNHITNQSKRAAATATTNVNAGRLVANTGERQGMSQSMNQNRNSSVGMLQNNQHFESTGSFGVGKMMFSRKGAPNPPRRLTIAQSSLKVSTTKNHTSLSMFYVPRRSSRSFSQSHGNMNHPGAAGQGNYPTNARLSMFYNSANLMSFSANSKAGQIQKVKSGGESSKFKALRRPKDHDHPNKKRSTNLTINERPEPPPKIEKQLSLPRVRKLSDRLAFTKGKLQPNTIQESKLSANPDFDNESVYQEDAFRQSLAIADSSEEVGEKLKRFGSKGSDHSEKEPHSGEINPQRATASGMPWSGGPSFRRSQLALSANFMENAHQSIDIRDVRAAFVNSMRRTILLPSDQAARQSFSGGAQTLSQAANNLVSDVRRRQIEQDEVISKLYRTRRFRRDERQLRARMSENIRQSARVSMIPLIAQKLAEVGEIDVELAQKELSPNIKDRHEVKKNTSVVGGICAPAEICCDKSFTGFLDLIDLIPFDAKIVLMVFVLSGALAYVAFFFVEDYLPDDVLGLD